MIKIKTILLYLWTHKICVQSQLYNNFRLVIDFSMMNPTLKYSKPHTPHLYYYLQLPMKDSSTIRDFYLGTSEYSLKQLKLRVIWAIDNRNTPDEEIIESVSTRA